MTEKILFNNNISLSYFFFGMMLLQFFEIEIHHFAKVNLSLIYLNLFDSLEIKYCQCM